jgi:hypothetical protein
MRAEMSSTTMTEWAFTVRNSKGNLDLLLIIIIVFIREFSDGVQR